MGPGTLLKRVTWIVVLLGLGIYLLAGNGFGADGNFPTPPAKKGKPAGTVGTNEGPMAKKAHHAVFSPELAEKLRGPYTGPTKKFVVKDKSGAPVDPNAVLSLPARTPFVGTNKQKAKKITAKQLQDEVNKLELGFNKQGFSLLTTESPPYNPTIKGPQGTALQKTRINERLLNQQQMRIQQKHRPFDAQTMVAVPDQQSMQRGFMQNQRGMTASRQRLSQFEVGRQASLQMATAMKTAPAAAAQARNAGQAPKTAIVKRSIIPPSGAPPAPPPGQPPPSGNQGVVMIPQGQMQGIAQQLANNPAAMAMIAAMQKEPKPFVDNNSWSDSWGEKGTFAASLGGSVTLTGEKNRMTYSANGSASVTMFNEPFTLLGIDAQAGVPTVKPKDNTAGAATNVAKVDDNTTLQLEVVVLGDTVLKEYRIQESYKKDYDETYLNRDENVDWTFPIGPIPLNVKVGFKANLGLKGNVYLSGGRAEVKLGPYVKADAYAQVGVDLLIVEAGAGADLVLLKDTVELYGKVANELEDGTNEPYFTYQLSLYNDFSSLSGKIYAFVEVDLWLWSNRWDWTIYDYKGFNNKGYLFNVYKDKIYWYSQVKPYVLRIWAPTPTVQANQPVTIYGKLGERYRNGTIVPAPNRRISVRFNTSDTSGIEQIGFGAPDVTTDSAGNFSVTITPPQAGLITANIYSKAVGKEYTFESTEDLSNTIPVVQKTVSKATQMKGGGNQNLLPQENRTFRKDK